MKNIIDFFPKIMTSFPGKSIIFSTCHCLTENKFGHTANQKPVPCVCMRPCCLEFGSVIGLAIDKGRRPPFPQFTTTVTLWPLPGGRVAVCIACDPVYWPVRHRPRPALIAGFVGRSSSFQRSGSRSTSRPQCCLCRRPLPGRGAALTRLSTSALVSEVICQRDRRVWARLSTNVMADVSFHVIGQPYRL